MTVKNPRLILGVLAVLAIIGIGGGFLYAKYKANPGQNQPPVATTSTPPIIEPADPNKRIQPDGTSFTVPPFLKDTDMATEAVAGFQYSIRIESIASFPDSDTPWHTQADIVSEMKYIDQGGAAPLIQKHADALQRYSAQNVKGYFSYQCTSGDGNGLGSVFTFFDKENRYRFEILETKDEWKTMSASTFSASCGSHVRSLLNGTVSSEVETNYDIRQKMIESVEVPS